MEELLLLAGYHSDTDSIRSSITNNPEAPNVRKRSGRKQQAPRRAAFDSETSVAVTEQQQHAVFRTGAQYEQVTAESQAQAAPAAVSTDAVPAGDKPVEPEIGRPPSAPSARGKKTKQELAGPCCHCNATNSPQWRKGPKGKPVLCNACGIRFLRNRTLTKVVVKKRRAGSAAVRDSPLSTGAAAPKAKRLKTDGAAAEDQEFELATDEILATDDTLIATDDGTEEAYSRSLNPTAVPADLAVAPAAADQQSVLQHQLAAGGGSSSSSGGYEVHTSLVKCCSARVQQLAAGSTHLLLGASSRISPNPSLSLAIALHQQQQQGISPTAAGSGSPVSNASAYASDRSPCMHSDISTGSPPASPLVLGISSGVSSILPSAQQQQQVPSLWLPPTQQQQQKAATAASEQLLPEPAPLSLAGDTATTTTTAVPGHQGLPGQSGTVDILQLVQQISNVLGGVGPAVEFIKAMQAGGAAAAAAAVSLHQQQL